MSVPPGADRFGLTPELVEHIKDAEKLVLKPYICPAGYPTIGYGHRIPSMTHPVITAAQANLILEQDLLNYRNAVLRLSPGLRDHPQRKTAALVDFCFNLGIAAYAGSTLRKKVNAEDWVGAGKQMRLWVNAMNPKTGKKEPLKGLIIRRDKMAKWLEAE